MTAMIWKEWRENLKWAVLAALGMGLGMALARSGHDWTFDYQGDASLCSVLFLMVTLIGSAVAGSVLGYLQVVLESHRDQWGFLVHRPISRSSIFTGKVMAGLSLYLLATGIPFLVAVIWAATPGRVAAPFDWGMVQPGVADILNGVVFYFAGMLTGLRPARWYASRALGLGAAISCSIAVLAVPKFWHAMVVIAFFGGALAAAAWGSFVTPGGYRFSNRMARLGLGISFLLGMILVISTILAAAFALELRSMFEEYHQYVIDRGGTVLRVIRQNFQVTAIRDLEGKPVDRKLGEFGGLDSLPEVELLGPRYSFGNYRSSARHYFSVGRGSGAIWYYVPRRAWIEGYSLTDRHRLGFLGPDGFSPASAGGTRRFEGELLAETTWFQGHLFPFSAGVYWVDPFARYVKKVFPAAGHTQVLGACEVSGGRHETEPSLSVVVATAARIHVLDPGGEALFSVPYLHDRSQYGRIKVSMTRDRGRYFLWYEPWTEDDDEIGKTAEKPPAHIAEYAANGALLKQHLLPPLPMDVTPASAYVYVMAFALPPALPGGALSAFAYQWLAGKDPMKLWRHWMREFRENPREFIMIIVTIVLSGLSCALITALVCRRFATNPRVRWWWTCWNFVLGPPGLLTFLCVQEWPARVACPSCQRQRVVDRDTCEHCGAEFPLPALNGTEIVET